MLAVPTQVEGRVPASTSTPPGRIASPATLPASNKVATPARLTPIALAAALQVCVLGSNTSALLSVVATTLEVAVVHESEFASIPPNATTRPDNEPVTTDGSIATSGNNSRWVVSDPV